MSTRKNTDTQIKRDSMAFWPIQQRVGECKIWSGKARGVFRFYGRVCLSYPGPGQPKSVQTSVSRAVYVLDKQKPELLRNPEAGDVSHRCDNPLCINPDHLPLESRVANSQRRTCHSDSTCLGCIPPCIIIQPPLDRPEDQ